MSKQNRNKEKNFISLVAYAKNSEDSIKDFLIQIDNLMKEKFEAYEFIIVDDASTDKTKANIKEISDSINGNLTVVELAWEHGLEKGILAGIELAIGDFLIEFDNVDINYSVNEIMKIYNKCLEGYDIVSASPNEKLKQSSEIFYNYLEKISYRKMSLTTETFRIVSRRSLNRIMKSNEKIRYRKAIYHYSGFNTSIMKYEKLDKSKKIKDIKFIEKLNLGLDIFINHSDFATKVAINISIMFLVLTLFTMIYTVYSFIAVEDIQRGWTTTMLFLSGSFTGVFLILAILSKYMTAIMIELQNKPSYTFRSLDRLSKK